MEKNKILIVEDEKSLLRVIKAYFEKEGYDVYTALDGQEAIDIFNNVEINLMILDVMLPKINGFEILKIVRSQSNIPVIMMTALDDETNILHGYGLKADDYVTKPLNPKVLVAKVNNLINRIKKEDLTTDYKIGNLTIDFAGRKAFLLDKELKLSKTEFSLLVFLIRHNNKTCSRDLLLDEIWGLDVYVDDRIIDTYIKTLRKQLKPYKYIKTVFGIGYMFSTDDDE